MPMETRTAIDLVNNSICYKPGWTITATDFTGRHQSGICLAIEATSYETAREESYDGYPNANRPRACMIMLVGDLSLDEFLRGLFDILIRFETHEAREFFRVKPSMWAPYHPHRIDGIRRWGTPDFDLTFGFNAMNYGIDYVNRA